MNEDRLRRNLANWTLRIILIFFTVIFVYPFIWNLICSIKTNTEYLTDPYALPSSIHIENYVNAFKKANMGAYFLNSVYVVILSVGLLMVFVIPAAYVLARYRFKGSKVITTLYMACIFLQPTYIMIPLFLEVQKINGLNNLTVLSLVYAVMQFPFAIFTLLGFIEALPTGYEEAARIDGGTNFGILIRVVVPLCKPGIATITMLTAMGFWSEYPLALVLVTDELKRTIPIGLANLFEVQKYATDWGAMFAGLIIVLIPTLIIYLIGQKQLLQGITLGGIKG
ncbi:carbohydrate ABC transporter membrane protein 2, CUT1 family [Lachnospiraceae bacterium G11]|nr:carbohydrate ABC transporter membrane protein 2, CUT1 family [Lachnospiraceae bacterium G11]